MSYRENFFADYRTERTLKANGKGYRIRYIYCGDWCKWDLPTARLNRCKLICLALFASDLGIYLCAGLYPTPANTQPLVAGGGLLALACLVFEAVGLGQFLFTRRKAKARDCRDIHVTMAGSTLLRALFLIVACFGCAWSIRNGSCPASIWPLGGYLLCAILSLILYVLHHRLTFSVLPGDGSLFREDNEEDWPRIEAELLRAEEERRQADQAREAKLRAMREAAYARAEQGTQSV